MSYILQALKKAEQERELGQVPGIGTGQEQVGQSAGRRWLLLLLLALLANAVVLAVVFWPESAPQNVARPELPADTQPSPMSPAPAPAVVEAPASPAVVQSAPVTRTPAPVKLRPLPPLPESTAAAEVKIPRAKPAPVAPQAVNNNLPIWPQVSSHLFQQINSGLHLDVHVYSDVPAERFVLINMQKYNEGQQLQEGPTVDEITPEDVILLFRGQRFRVQSQ